MSDKNDSLYDQNKQAHPHGDSAQHGTQPLSGQDVPLGVHGGVSGGDAVTPPTGDPDTNTPTGSPTAPGDPSDGGAPAG